MMQPTPKISARLMAIGLCCLSLTLVFCNSVWTQETTKTNPRIKEFQKQRLAVLEEIRDAAKKLYPHARVSLEDVHAAECALLDARLAYAETRDDRIKACDEAIQNAIDWQQITQGRKESARGTHIEVLKAQAHLLETKIRRENVETGE